MVGPTGLTSCASVSESLERMLAGTRALNPESLPELISVACTPAIAANWLVRVIDEVFSSFAQAMGPGYIGLVILFDKGLSEDHEDRVFCGFPHETV